MDQQTKKILEDMMRDGTLDPWERCVVGEGVFFKDERSAPIFAQKSNRTLTKIEMNRLHGWLVQNPI
jgi:hypothetical protein